MYFMDQAAQALEELPELHESDLDTGSSDSEDDSDDSDDSDDGLFDKETLQTIYNELETIQNSRYLAERTRWPKAVSWHQRIARLESPKDFKSLYRVSMSTFEGLLALIQDHNVFQNNSTCPQAPVDLQLLVTIYFLGGGGPTRVKCSQFFDIGEGTVSNYIRRCIKAIRTLKNRLIVWPRPGTADYKATVDMHMHYHGLPNCLGFIDGTHFGIWRKPLVQGQSYWTYKNQYSFNGTFVVDAETRILNFLIGSMSFFNCS
jgi:hypothetical protein